MKHYRPLQPIAAMTFDLDDTLYDNRPVIERLEREVLAWLATQHPATQVMSHSDWSQLKRDVAASSPPLRSDVTQLRHQQLTEAFLRLGYDVAAAQQAADEGVAVALYWRSQLVVPSETHRVMRLLADKLPLVAITNGNVDVAAIGLQGYFQAVLKAGPDGVARWRNRPVICSSVRSRFCSCQRSAFSMLATICSRMCTALTCMVLCRAGSIQSRSTYVSKPKPKLFLI